MSPYYDGIRSLVILSLDDKNAKVISIITCFYTLQEMFFQLFQYFHDTPQENNDREENIDEEISLVMAIIIVKYSVILERSYFQYETTLEYI